VLTEQDAIGGTIVAIRGQGDHPRVVQMNARCLVTPGEDRVSILLAIEDVTGQQRLTDALRSDNADLTAADTARNRFVAVLSHELRSPLSAISAWTRIMQGGTMDADEIETALAIVDRNARALARLIEELLDVHRITSGTVALEMAALDLVALVRLAVEVHGPAAAERRVRLEFYGDLSTAVVAGESNRLQQVLGNLLGNAIKFTPAGGRVRVDVRLAAGNVEVRVEDTGEGIAPAVLPHLFDRSHPLAPFSRGKGGLGLGLSISKQLVALHGGTISASSSGRGKGATFRLSFPLLTVEDGDGDALERPGGDVAPPPLPLAGRSVLVVAGAADAREALRRSLEDAGCETFVSGSVDEALAAMDRRLPDVIVSDLDGPAGCALISAVRARSQEMGGRVPAITLTDYTSADDRERALRAGFERHLPKPAAPASLIATAALVYQHATTGADRA
jgi:signal transduction histidine kinase/CheY-like chemotaxis protein